jgi:hypothetical protein
MKLSTIVLKDPESCKGAIESMAALRKCTGKRELFFGNGLALTDSVPKYTNDKKTVVRRKPTDPKLPVRLPDGSDIELYYVSFNEPTDEQKAAAANAIANGVDPRFIKGKLCDVTFAKEGHAIMLVTNSNRVNPDGGPSYRVVSLKTGVVVAMAVNRGLGISMALLKQDGDKYEAANGPIATGPLLPMMPAVGVTGAAPADPLTGEDADPGEEPAAPEAEAEPVSVEPELPAAAPSDKHAELLAKLKDMPF